MMRDELELELRVMREELAEHNNAPRWEEYDETIREMIREHEEELEHYEEWCQHKHLDMNSEGIYVCGRCGKSNLTEEQINNTWSKSYPIKSDKFLEDFFRNARIREFT